MKDLHVFFDGADWVVSHDPDDAVKAWEEHNGGNYEVGYYVCNAFEQLPDDKLLTMHTDGIPVTLSCAEWASQEGRGFLMAMDY